jgi:DNA-binding response OmpR family regulator
MRSPALSWRSAGFQLERARLIAEDNVVRILVVEDHRRVASAIKRGLEAEGYVVEIAGDGEQGLWLARTRPYDAIILDILLPKVNGYKVCAAVRDAGDWTPILMLSAKAGEWDEAEALDTGADDFLAKPFSFVVLVAHLRALLRRGARPRLGILTTGDLTLDPVGHRCRRGETDIPLSPREFALLEFFMQRADQVISKPEIIDHVWDFDFEGDENIVEVYVRYLRKKIDLPFGRHALETVRGAGYRLASSGG